MILNSKPSTLRPKKMKEKIGGPDYTRDLSAVGIGMEKALEQMKRFAWQSLKGHGWTVKRDAENRSIAAYATEVELASEDGKLATRSDIVGVMESGGKCMPFIEEVRKRGKRREGDLFENEVLEMSAVHLCARESAEAVAGRLDYWDQGAIATIKELPHISVVWAETQQGIGFDGRKFFGEVRNIEKEIRQLNGGSEVPKRGNCDGCLVYKQCDRADGGFKRADKL
jgi:hypothetical protein